MRVTGRWPLALLLAVNAALAESAGDARDWLQRMTEAVEYLNYEGTLVYMAPGRSETFRVYHRVDDAQVVERLVALDGAGSEIIRSPNELICIFPETATVVVQQRSAGQEQANPLQARLPTYRGDVTGHYRLELNGDARVLGRSAVVVAIRPRDEFRYGYRLWLDALTAMPLRSQLIGGDPELPVEEIRFTEITMPEQVAPGAVQTSLDTTGFTWIRQSATESVETAGPALDDWTATDLPPGFELTMGTLQHTESSEVPRIHLVYSDGLASVSVFVDTGAPEDARVEGLSMIGAANAYSVTRNGKLVTAMGEVPPRTVERIAFSMRRVGE